MWHPPWPALLELLGAALSLRVDHRAKPRGLSHYTGTRWDKRAARAVSYMDKHTSCQPYRTCELIHKVYDMIH